MSVRRSWCISANSCFSWPMHIKCISVRARHSWPMHLHCCECTPSSTHACHARNAGASAAAEKRRAAAAAVAAAGLGSGDRGGRMTAWASSGPIVPSHAAAAAATGTTGDADGRMLLSYWYVPVAMTMDTYKRHTCVLLSGVVHVFALLYIW